MICRHIYEVSQCPECRYQEGHNDGLEEAAKVATDFCERTNPEHDWYATKFAIAEAIRALKGARL